jgi:hypothetical protein
MPKMPKSVQRRGQFVTAPCRVVTAFVTGSPMRKSLIDNKCYGVTAENPREPAARAVLSAFVFRVFRGLLALLPPFQKFSLPPSAFPWSLVPIPLTIIPLTTAFSRSFPTLNCWLISNRFRPFQSNSKQKKNHEFRKTAFWAVFRRFQPEQAACQRVPTEMCPLRFVLIRGRSC